MGPSYIVLVGLVQQIEIFTYHFRSRLNSGNHLAKSFGYPNPKFVDTLKRLPIVNLM